MELQTEIKSITRASKNILPLNQNNFCLGCSDTPMAHEGLFEFKNARCSCESKVKHQTNNITQNGKQQDKQQRVNWEQILLS